jgi:hypothetical protein
VKFVPGLVDMFIILPLRQMGPSSWPLLGHFHHQWRILLVVLFNPIWVDLLRGFMFNFRVIVTFGSWSPAQLLAFMFTTFDISLVLVFMSISIDLWSNGAAYWEREKLFVGARAVERMYLCPIS